MSTITERFVRQPEAKPSPLKTETTVCPKGHTVTVAYDEGDWRPTVRHCLCGADLLKDSATECLRQTRYLAAETLFLGASGYRIDRGALPALEGSPVDIDRAEAVRYHFCEEWSEARAILAFWPYVEAGKLQDEQDEFIRTCLGHVEAGWWVRRADLNPAEGWLRGEGSPWLRCPATDCARPLRPAEYRLACSLPEGEQCCSRCGPGPETTENEEQNDGRGCQWQERAVA